MATEFRLLTEEELSKLTEEELEELGKSYINYLREMKEDIIITNNKLNKKLKDLGME